MKCMSAARMLLVLAIILLISVPLCLMMKSQADAGETSESITAYDSDYVFFVIEENKTPLAAVPFETSSANYSVVLIIALAFSAIICFGYSIWYAGTRNRIINLVRFLPKTLRNNLVSQLSILHPVRAHQLSREAEYDVANLFSNF